MSIERDLNKGMWFYERIEGPPLSVWNVHHIRALWDMMCLGQPPCSSLHLRVSHPKLKAFIGADVVESIFSKISSFSIQEGPKIGFKKGTLILEGKSPWSQTYDTFALLELNMAMLKDDKAPQKLSLTLSPIKLDPSGRPVLPYEGAELEWFRSVARIVLGMKTGKGLPPSFTGSELHLMLLQLMPPGAELKEDVAYKWMEKLDALGLIKNIFRPGGIYEPTISVEEFEKVFGIKL